MRGATSRQTRTGAPSGWQEDMSRPQLPVTWKSTAQAYLVAPPQLHRHLQTQTHPPALTHLCPPTPPAPDPLTHLPAPTQPSRPTHRVDLPTRLPAPTHQVVLPTHLPYLSLPLRSARSPSATCHQDLPSTPGSGVWLVGVSSTAIPMAPSVLTTM